MDRPRRPDAFPRWPSRITRPEEVPEPATGRPAPKPRARLANLAHQGWTVWFGRHTRQYWAAHTGRMRLVCADTPEDLARAVTRAQVLNGGRGGPHPVGRWGSPTFRIIMEPCRQHGKPGTQPTDREARAMGKAKAERPADQAWFWDHEWQRGERQASEQIAAGRTEEFEDAGSMFDALEDKEP